MRIDIDTARKKPSRINFKRHETAFKHLLCLLGCIGAAFVLHFGVLLIFPNMPFFLALVLLIVLTFACVYGYLYRETRPAQ